MNTVGKAEERKALEFIARHDSVQLGSRTSDGLRRVMTRLGGADLQTLKAAFAAYGAVSHSINPSPIAESSPPGVGSVLKRLIETEIGVTTSCGQCDAEMKTLNSMSTQEILNDLESISERIHNNAQSLSLPWYLAIATKYVPNLAKAKIKELIRKACEQYSPSQKKVSSWAYGITTVPSRKDVLFPQTLESLINAGFDSPRIFVDNCSFSQAEKDYVPFGFPVTVRDHIKTAGHWILTLWELYARNPKADRYAVFQDDFLSVRNLKQYLEQSPYPEKGYLNLYTFPSNQALAGENKGWFESNQNGLGAVALVFSNTATQTLLCRPHLVERFHGPKANKSIDGGIVEAFRAVGFKEYVHNPSLVQHTGIESSMGNRQQPLAPSFPGDDFDALTLL